MLACFYSGSPNFAGTLIKQYRIKKEIVGGTSTTAVVSLPPTPLPFVVSFVFSFVVSPSGVNRLLKV
jgi:hypothetical protein